MSERHSLYDWAFPDEDNIFWPAALSQCQAVFSCSFGANIPVTLWICLLKRKISNDKAVQGKQFDFQVQLLQAIPLQQLFLSLALCKWIRCSELMMTEKVKSKTNPAWAGEVWSLDHSLMKWGFILAKAVMNISNNKNNNDNNNDKAVFRFSAEDKWARTGAKTFLKPSTHCKLMFSSLLPNLFLLLGYCTHSILVQ